MPLLLDVSTTQIPNTWVYGTITGLLGLLMCVVIYVYQDFKSYMKGAIRELKEGVNGLHKDLEPIKIELGVHKEKIEKVEKKVEVIYERQIHDSRDIQVLQLKTAQLSKTG